MWAQIFFLTSPLGLRSIYNFFFVVYINMQLSSLLLTSIMIYDIKQSLVEKLVVTLNYNLTQYH